MSGWMAALLVVVCTLVAAGCAWLWGRSVGREQGFTAGEIHGRRKQYTETSTAIAEAKAAREEALAELAGARRQLDAMSEESREWLARWGS